VEIFPKRTINSNTSATWYVSYPGTLLSLQRANLKRQIREFPESIGLRLPCPDDDRSGNLRGRHRPRACTQRTIAVLKEESTRCIALSEAPRIAQTVTVTVIVVERKARGKRGSDCAGKGTRGLSRLSTVSFHPQGQRCFFPSRFHFHHRDCDNYNSPSGERRSISARTNLIYPIVSFADLARISRSMRFTLIEPSWEIETFLLQGFHNV